MFEDRTTADIGLQEIMDPPARRGIARAGGIKIGRTFRGRQSAGGDENLGFPVGVIVHCSVIHHEGPKNTKKNLTSSAFVNFVPFVVNKFSPVG